MSLPSDSLREPDVRRAWTEDRKNYLDYATTATGVPITECGTCGKRHPVTRQHCRRCLSWSAFQDAGLCTDCAKAGE